MSTPLFKVVYIHWWNLPVRLMRRHNGGLQVIGWVWLQRAYLVKNAYEGWIAFAEDQVPEKLDHWFCTHCGTPIRNPQQQKIQESTKESSK